MGFESNFLDFWYQN